MESYLPAFLLGELHGDVDEFRILRQLCSGETAISDHPSNLSGSIMLKAARNKVYVIRSSTVGAWGTVNVHEGRVGGGILRLVSSDRLEVARVRDDDGAGSGGSAAVQGREQDDSASVI